MDSSEDCLAPPELRLLQHAAKFMDIYGFQFTLSQEEVTQVPS